MSVTPLQLFAGLALDVAFGDPRWLPHPVTFIGRFARANEHFWRRVFRARIAGIAAWLCVIATTAGIVQLTLHYLPAPFIQIYWVYSFLALRSLDQHALAVIRQLRERDLPAARQAVAMIVGRDTSNLTEPEITRAVFETVAESLNDGIIAPLFWLAVGGPAGMAVYKAINTLDSMFGYRNERYLHFGWASARADDAANLVPARLSAVLIAIAAAILPHASARRAVTTTLRDAARQPSPNSGYPEAAAAGALGVRLGGVNYYGGQRSVKAYLGDEYQPLRWHLYGRLRGLMYSSVLLFAAMIGGLAAWR